MNRSLWSASGLSLGVALVVSGCYVRAEGPPPAGPAPVATDATLYPTTPPPDPIPEDQPPPPGYGYNWIGGYWDWTGYDWSWDAGYWAPQEAGYLFIGPRFEFVDGRPVYYRSYWQGPGGRRSFGYGFRGNAPGVAFRGRTTVAPNAWRAEHNEGWRRNPGAAGWRGAPARGEPMRRAEPMRAEPGRGAPMRAEPGRGAPTRAEPGRGAPMRAEPGRGAPTRAEPARAAPMRAGPRRK